MSRNYCKGLCKENKELFYKKHYGYENGSYCKHCKRYVKIPTTRKIPIGVAIAPNPDNDRHPELKIGRSYFDEKGWKHTILARLCLFEKKWVEKVPCPCCKRITKGTKVNKNRNNLKEKSKLSLKLMPGLELKKQNKILYEKEMALIRRQCKENEFKTLEILQKRLEVEPEPEPGEWNIDLYGNVKTENQLKGVKELIYNKVIPMQTLTQKRKQEEFKIKSRIDYYIDEIRSQHGQGKLTLEDFRGTRNSIYWNSIYELIQFMEEETYSYGDTLERICQYSDSEKMRKKYTRYLFKKLFGMIPTISIKELQDDTKSLPYLEQE